MPESLSLLKPTGHSPWLIGVDEAGRGCLAGPVVAAAVLLPPRYHLPDLNDSKVLKAAQREALYGAVRAQSLAWGLGLAWQGEVDKRNILQATFWAMSRAVASLRPASLASLTPHFAGGPAEGQTVELRIDGNKTIPEPVLKAVLEKGHPALSLPRQKAIVDGDALLPCISAASILAKTFRDALMVTLHKRYPRYGFDQHKGYGTKEHLAALREHGPCPLHRVTFAGVLPPKAPPSQGTLL